MLKLAVFIGKLAGLAQEWPFRNMLRHHFRNLRNVMVRFTFLKDHLDIPTKDKLEVKKKKGKNELEETILTVQIRNCGMMGTMKQEWKES